jgi:hypothetical protein
MGGELLEMLKVVMQVQVAVLLISIDAQYTTQTHHSQVHQLIHDLPALSRYVEVTDIDGVVTCDR